MRTREKLRTLALLFGFMLTQSACFITTTPICGEENASEIFQPALAVGKYAFAVGENPLPATAVVKGDGVEAYSYVDIRTAGKPGFYEYEILAKQVGEPESKDLGVLRTCEVNGRSFYSLKTAESDGHWNNYEFTPEAAGEFYFTSISFDKDSDCFTALKVAGLVKLSGFSFNNDAVSREALVACLKENDFREKAGLSRGVRFAD